MTLAGVDLAVLDALRSCSSPGLTAALWLCTVLGGTVAVAGQVLGAGVLLASWGRRRDALVLALTVGGGALLVDWLKVLVGRVRPGAGGAWIDTPTTASFPSGHAAAAVLLYGGLALVVLSGRSLPLRLAGAGAAIALAAAVGLSRVYLGVHWFTDVAASWALGALLLSVMARVRVRGARARTRAVPEDACAGADGRTAARRRAAVALATSLVLAGIGLQAALDPLVLR